MSEWIKTIERLPEEEFKSPERKEVKNG